MATGPNPFAALLQFCRACGHPGSPSQCPQCGAASTRLVAQDTGATGGWGVVRRGLRKSRCLAVSPDYAMMTTDGVVFRADFRSVSTFEHPVAGKTWTVAGALLANDLAYALPPKMHEGVETLVQQAIASGDLQHRRSLLVDMTRLGRHDLVQLLGLTATELIWWRATTFAAAGDLHAAVIASATLPSDRYPAKIAIWYRAVNAGAVNAAEAARLAELIDPIEDDEVVGAAIEVLRSTLNPLLDRAYDPTRLVTCATRVATGESSAVWRERTTPGAGGPSRSGLAELLAAHSGDSSTLRSYGPHALASASPSLLDDIIDAGGIPQVWLDHGECVGAAADYITARTRPEMLDDDTLRSLRCNFELARRAAMQGEPVPTRLPVQARIAYATWSAARNGDVSALATALGAKHPWHDNLTALGADPSVIPEAQIVADGSLRPMLARNCNGNFSRLDIRRLTQDQREFAGQVLLLRSRAFLYEWSWNDAVGAARECLRFARREDLRDEALNLLACALWMTGNVEGAVTALSTAIEGEHSEALQANFAVVAAAADPKTSADHLARLVLEGGRLDLRLSAALRAVEIWDADPEPWNQDDEDAMPPSLLDALRAIVLEAIPLDDFRRIAKLLAIRDGDWMSRTGFKSSPHRDSTEAYIWASRAHGFEEFLAALARTLMTPSPPQWVSDERDELVAVASAVLITDEPSLGAVSFGMLMLDKGLPMPTDDKVVLRAFVARGAALAIDPEEGEPAEKFLIWLEQADRDLAAVPDALRERARIAIDLGFRSLAIAHVSARWGLFKEAAEFHDSMIGQLSRIPRYRINRDAVRGSAQPIRSYCAETKQLLRRLRPHVTDAEVLKWLDDLSRAVNELDASTTRNFLQ